MATFKLLNKRNVEFNLTDNPYLYLIDIDGQTTAAADVSTSVIGGLDGDTINSQQVQPRTVALTMKVKLGVSVEQAKRALLSVAKIKQELTLQWYQEGKTLILKGNVEEIDVPRWENGVALQLTLHCSQPYWEDIAEAVQEITQFISLHYFTEDPLDQLYFTDEGQAFGMYDFSRSRLFKNEGDVAIGFEARIVAVKTVTNPIIYDTDGNFFGVGYGTGAKKLVMNAGDVLIITTHKGNKTVKLNGVSQFDKIKPQSQWLQMQTGENQFAVNSDDQDTENIFFNFNYKQRYV